MQRQQRDDEGTAQRSEDDDDSWLDWGQGGLDTASLALDATGLGGAVSWVPDVANAGISAGRGDWAGAGLSMAAAIPFVGAAANATRLGRTAAKHGDEAVDLARRGSKAGDSARGGTYKLRDPETGEVRRTDRTKDLKRRSDKHRRDPRPET
ncbi:MAG: hypothetical protein Tsb0020_55320 [Haliangiales bacterium]